MLVAIVVAGWASSGVADSLEGDSVSSLPMERVEVRAHRSASSAGTSRIPASSLERADAATVDKVLRLVPSAQVAINSRGEAILGIRGGSERFTGVFLDGAPLALPWDQRIDLSMVPGSVVGSVEVDQGSSTILQGPWAAGGVVDLRTRRRAEDGVGGRVRLGAGALEARSGEVLLMGRGQGFAHTSAAGFATRDGRPVADRSKSDDPSLLSLHQPSATMRTNTDERRSWFSTSVERTASGGARWGASLGSVDAQKGEPPSGMVGDKARFWRYPEWRLLRASAWGSDRWGGIDLASNAWVSSASQVVDQFQGLDYGARDASEEGRDLAWGLRTAGSGEVGTSTGLLGIGIAAQGQWSRHDQRTDAFEADGTRTEGQELTFRQWQSSLGAELGWDAGPWAASLGASLDGTGTISSGDKPGNPAVVAPGLAAAVEFSTDRTWRTWISGGMRTRAPSLREQYGEALRKFAPNPDLRPETFHTLEWGASASTSRIRGQAAIFRRLELDRIDQQSLPDRRNRRINLDEVLFWGVEGSASVVEPWGRLDGRGIWLVSSTDDPRFPGGEIPRTPAWSSSLEAVAARRLGMEPAVEWQWTGPTHDLLGPQRVELPSAERWNLRLSWTPLRPGRTGIETHLRLDNAFDVPWFPQMGLPADGRTWSAGADLTF